MASNTVTNKKGYDCKFVNPVPDSLICLICTFVAREPQQATCCGKIYCKRCLEDLTVYSTCSAVDLCSVKCPHCRLSWTDRSTSTFPDKKSDRDIKALEVHCDDKCCEWTGDLNSLEKHLTWCDFALLPCHNECKDESERIVQVLRKDLNKHEREECPRQQYKCPHCMVAGEYQERTTAHYDKCPKVLIPCPNSNCFISISRCELSDHRKICQFERVSCKYANIGCKMSILRRDLTKHENDSQYHLQIAIDAVNALQTKYLVLASSKGDPYYSAQSTFQLANFHKHKTNNDIIYSPPFYTGPGGYKLCVRVDANGCGAGEGTHVSVFVYLMRGEYDDHLSWPFPGKVTIELLNQLQNTNHHSTTTLFSADIAEGQRVVDAERASSGRGQQKFIPYTSLEYSITKNCQYLKDNSLYFRFKVARASNPKPWLTASGQFSSNYN